MAVGVAKVKVRFKLGHRELTLDYRKLPFTAWSELKVATTFTQATLLNALNTGDLDAVVALIWLERKQRERKLRYVDVYQELIAADADEQDFEILDLIVDGKSATGEPVDAGGDEDPTGGS